MREPKKAEIQIVEVQLEGLKTVDDIKEVVGVLRYSSNMGTIIFVLNALLECSFQDSVLCAAAKTLKAYQAKQEKGGQAKYSPVFRQLEVGAQKLDITAGNYLNVLKVSALLQAFQERTEQYVEDERKKYFSPKFSALEFASKNLTGYSLIEASNFSGIAGTELHKRLTAYKPNREVKNESPVVSRKVKEQNNELSILKLQEQLKHYNEILKKLNNLIVIQAGSAVGFNQSMVIIRDQINVVYPLISKVKKNISDKQKKLDYILDTINKVSGFTKLSSEDQNTIKKLVTQVLVNCRWKDCKPIATAISQKIEKAMYDEWSLFGKSKKGVYISSQGIYGRIWSDHPDTLSIKTLENAVDAVTANNMSPLESNIISQHFY